MGETGGGLDRLGQAYVRLGEDWGRFGEGWGRFRKLRADLLDTRGGLWKV